MAITDFVTRVFDHAADPEHVACVFPKRGHEVLTYRRLWDQSATYAAALHALGVRADDRIAVVMTTSPEVVILIVALLRMGATLVPVTPRAPSAATAFETELIVNAVRHAQARVFIAEARTLDAHEALFRREGLSPCVVAIERLCEATTPPPSDVYDPDRLVFLQFSSGSTGLPKPVPIRRSNLTANVAGVAARLGGRPSDRGVTWLPLFHDFGLVASLCGALYTGCPLWMLPPMSFVRDPLEWIRLLSETRATLTGAPQFAYALCGSKRADPTLLSSLDLSSLRVALNAGEMVDWSASERFVQRFTPFGLRPHVLQPAYGLAENTVAVTMRPPGTPVPHYVDARGRTFVACGHPIDGTVLRIDATAEASPGGPKLGEILVRGTSTAALDAGMMDRGWLPTGDLGFVLDGELYVAGRLKEVFKFGGALHSPIDVERFATRALGAIGRPASVGAFAYHDVEAGRDEVVVLIEYAGRLSGAEYDELSAAARLAITRDLRLPLKAVHVVRRGSLPRTSSGKLKRALLAQAYTLGRLDVVVPILH